MDGETEVTLGTTSEVNPGGRPAFDDELETPNRVVIVSTVEGKQALQSGVPFTSARVRIWVNHPTEPDKVIVGIG